MGQEEGRHPPTVENGARDVPQPCERSAEPSSNSPTDCGYGTPTMSSGRNQPLHVNGGRMATYPDAVSIDTGGVEDSTNSWDLSVYQASRDNKFQNMVSGIRTFNVFGQDGKIAAKFHLFSMGGVSTSPSFLDAKLCVLGSDLSISLRSVSRSLLLSRICMQRTPFQDNPQQKKLPLLQWNNDKIGRQEARNFVHEYEEEIKKVKYEVHQARMSAQEADGENGKLQQEFSCKSLHITSLVDELDKLKEKFAKQSRDLKSCHNQVLELKGNIRVFCRCRPLNIMEANAGETSVIEFDVVHGNELYVHAHEGVKKVFKFDRVFTPSHDQVDVFMETAPLVVSVLDGFNVCIFAYGQTGTGKTFTMEGSEINRGVNYRTLEELFRVASERKGQYEYAISVSVVEVYNEAIWDLLTPSPASGQNAKKLEIKQGAEGIHHVPGVTEASVHCIEEAWKVLQTGSNARAVGCTNANKHSSRSHCMLCIVVKGENLLTGECSSSKLWLVDLAGSERIGKTNVQGERLKEAQSINKSLSALGDVIHALANKSSHIPYRNSKITHLLQDSLGGQSKTLMFVQISPSEQDIGETLCSLNFASRVRGIELGGARKQFESADLLKYKKLVDKFKEDGKLKDKIIKELQEAFKVKEQTCKALSAKVKEKEGLFEVERKARSIAEAELREQRTLNEKQKLVIEKLTAELRAKDSGILQETVTQRPPSTFKASALKRPPLHEKLMDNRGEMTEAIQRLKKRPAEGYLQKENACGELDGDVLPSRILPRRASMCTMQRQWPSMPPPAIPPYSETMSKKRAVEKHPNHPKENASGETSDEIVSSRVILQKPGRVSICQVPHKKPFIAASIPSFSMDISKKSHQEEPVEEFLAPRILSRRRQGRASMCVLPQRQPSWAGAAPPCSPLFKFAVPKRRPSMASPIVSYSASCQEENMLAPASLPYNIEQRTPRRLKGPCEILFKSPYAIHIGGEVQGIPKARRVSSIPNAVHGKPPQHPHPRLVNKELQLQTNRVLNQVEEEESHRLNKMRRLSTVSSLSWERPSQLWTLPAATTTPATAALDAASNNACYSSCGGAQRVPWTDAKKKSSTAYQRERGWSR